MVRQPSRSSHPASALQPLMRSTTTAFQTHHPRPLAPVSQAVQTAILHHQPALSATTALQVPDLVAHVSATASPVVATVSSLTVVAPAAATVTIRAPAARPTMNTFPVTLAATELSYEDDETSIFWKEGGRGKEINRPFIRCGDLPVCKSYMHTASRWFLTRTTRSRIRGSAVMILL